MYAHHSGWWWVAYTGSRVPRDLTDDVVPTPPLVPSRATDGGVRTRSGIVRRVCSISQGHPPASVPASSNVRPPNIHARCGGSARVAVPARRRQGVPLPPCPSRPDIVAGCGLTLQGRWRGQVGYREPLTLHCSLTPGATPSPPPPPASLTRGRGVWVWAGEVWITPIGDVASHPLPV